MTQTPIYEEVRRALGRSDRVHDRRSFRSDDAADVVSERPSRPTMLRGGGGRHRRPGES